MIIMMSPYLGTWGYFSTCFSNTTVRIFFSYREGSIDPSEANKDRVIAYMETCAHELSMPF